MSSDECPAAPVVYSTFVHRRDGKPFTIDGIIAMFRRYCGLDKANVHDFVLRDLRANDTTGEHKAGRSLRELQHLLGHRSIRMAEIY